MNKFCKTLTVVAFGSFLLNSTYAMAAETRTADMPSTGPVSASTEACLISCVDPTSNNIESQKVIDTLELLEKSLNSGDYTTFQQYIDETCTTFDEHSRHLIAGKEAVMQSVISGQAKRTAKGMTPLTSYTIEHPYAQVLGNTAIVTFVAVCQTGGKHHIKESCKGTDVFVKDGDKWKEVHYRGSWRRIG